MVDSVGTCQNSGPRSREIATRLEEHVELVGATSTPESTRVPSFGPNTPEVEQFLAELRTLDGRRAFVGSQSLRRLELDERREVGIMIRERKIVSEIEGLFNADWRQR